MLASRRETISCLRVRFDLLSATEDADSSLFNQSPATAGRLQPSFRAMRSTVWTKVWHYSLDSYLSYVLTSAYCILVLLPIDCTFDPEVPDNLIDFIRDNVGSTVERSSG